MEEKKQAACYLLDKFFAQLATWPIPTGLSVYQPRPSDVVVATYPKSGTTLLQNMAYQIAVATGGAPPFDPTGTNFRDIEQVAPWVDYAPQFGITDCPSNPRIFKTHSAAQNFDITKSKFIYCIRSPLDWPASWLDFLFDWLAEENTSDPEIREQIFHEFVRRRLLGKEAADHQNGSLRHATPDEKDTGAWFLHVKHWTAKPAHNLLVLFYEEIVKDLRGTAKQVAEFMGRELDSEGLETVVQRCDRDVMAADSKFGCIEFSKLLGADPEKGGRKAVQDRKTGFKAVKMEQESLEACERSMQSVFGVRSYEELCKLIREKHKLQRMT